MFLEVFLLIYPHRNRMFNGERQDMLDDYIYIDRILPQNN